MANLHGDSAVAGVAAVAGTHQADGAGVFGTSVAASGVVGEGRGDIFLAGADYAGRGFVRVLVSPR